MTIGTMRRFALQLVCALSALAFPLAATAADDARKPDKTKKTSQVTGSIGAAAKASAEPTPGTAAPSATLGGDVMHTRFLIGLPKEVEYRVFSLNNPHRVIVDIAETALQLPP